MTNGGWTVRTDLRRHLRVLLLPSAGAILSSHHCFSSLILPTNITSACYILLLLLCLLLQIASAGRR